jgi:hypothetical protein
VPLVIVTLVPVTEQTPVPLIPKVEFAFVDVANTPKVEPYGAVAGAFVKVTVGVVFDASVCPLIDWAV